MRRQIHPGAGAIIKIETAASFEKYGFAACLDEIAIEREGDAV
jgi:hypothetical protein